MEQRLDVTDLRIMSLCAFRCAGAESPSTAACDVHCVVSGNSMGDLKLFVVDESKQELKLVSQVSM